MCFYMFHRRMEWENLNSVTFAEFTTSLIRLPIYLSFVYKHKSIDIYYKCYFIHQIYNNMFLLCELFLTSISHRFSNCHSLYAPNIRIPLYYCPHKLHYDQFRQTCNDVIWTSHIVKGTSCLTRVYTVFWNFKFDHLEYGGKQLLDVQQLRLIEVKSSNWWGCGFTL